MKLTFQDYKFMTKWLGVERDVKSLLYEVADLQLALIDSNRKKDVTLTLATIEAIVTRLAIVNGCEDEVRLHAEEINRCDYELIYDKCKDMSDGKFYYRD